MAPSSKYEKYKRSIRILTRLKRTKRYNNKANLNGDKTMTDAKTTKNAKTNDFVADRESDLNPLADKDDGNKNTDTSGRDITGVKTQAQPDKGEQLAQEAVEKRSAAGGEITGKKNEAGGFTVTQTPVEDKSDNGKVYKDARIDPRDTNAPDAGLTPDGRRIAE